MKILVACEFSGKVRDAFKSKGHDVISCDIIPTEKPGNHYQGDVMEIINNGFDMLIAFPPCTYLCLAGIRWNNTKPGRQEKTLEAIKFFEKLWYANIDKICIENPVGVIPRYTGVKWSQMIHPWQFGHEEEKKTCLYLKNLPLLKPTQIMEKRESKMWKMSPSKDRSKLRSITYDGIAKAMAGQWG